MNHKVDVVYNCLKKIAVKAPFENPMSNIKGVRLD